MYDSTTGASFGSLTRAFPAVALARSLARSLTDRFWAVDNVYCKQNGGDYDFVVEKKGDAPDFKNFAWYSERGLAPEH